MIINLSFFNIFSNPIFPYPNEPNFPEWYDDSEEFDEE